MNNTKRYGPQIVAALFMTFSGIAAGAVSRPYHMPFPEQEVFAGTVETRVAPQKALLYLAEEAPEQETEAEPIFIPSADQLNLAFFYPEGADQSDVLNSYAGSVFRELMRKDAEWLSSIYDLSGKEPSVIASRLGKPAGSVRGKYNPADKKQDRKKPETWVLRSWDKVNITFCDENGKTVAPYSNVKDILSMASVYTYYTGMEDSDAFRAYALNLWERSHSYSYSCGEVYYCDGDCLAGEEMETESEAALAAETQPEAAESTPEETAGSTAPETAAAETEIQTAASKETKAAEIGPGAALTETVATPSEAARPTRGMLQRIQAAMKGGVAEKTEAEKITCPGIFVLNVRAVITGLPGLMKREAAGKEKTGEGGWNGWDQENIAAAVSLEAQDWSKQYGLEVTSICLGNPLSPAEIRTYLSQLPGNLSEDRKKVIRFALSSVGKVPYYWGGKPSSGNYEGNAFGSLQIPDEKGRMLRGLDCSGWINWVYWSALGMRLPYEGTQGLSQYGTAVKRSDLLPGDIIVRLGSSAHVVMFLGWEADGRMRVIHETSGGINNVAVSVMEANWPYYRRIIN